MKFNVMITTAILVLAACNQQPDTAASEGRKVDASGKVVMELEAVPEAVMAAARAARPELTISAAEYETRDGNEYYDVGGALPDGSALELDMTLVDGVWTVVEIQRDIDFEAVPAMVREALAAHAPEWSPDRIIESDQGNGIVIYEFFGPGETEDPTKIEVKFEADAAEVLVDEWLH